MSFKIQIMICKTHDVYYLVKPRCPEKDTLNMRSIWLTHVVLVLEMPHCLVTVVGVG